MSKAPQWASQSYKATDYLTGGDFNKMMEHMQECTEISGAGQKKIHPLTGKPSKIPTYYWEVVDQVYNKQNNLLDRNIKDLRPMLKPIAKDLYYNRKVEYVNLVAQKIKKDNEYQMQLDLIQEQKEIEQQQKDLQNEQNILVRQQYLSNDKSASQESSKQISGIKPIEKNIPDINIDSMDQTMFPMNQNSKQRVTFMNNTQQNTENLVQLAEQMDRDFSSFKPDTRELTIEGQNENQIFNDQSISGGIDEIEQISQQFSFSNAFQKHDPLLKTQDNMLPLLQQTKTFEKSTMQNTMMSMPSDDVSEDNSMIKQRLCDSSDLIKESNVGDSSSIFMPNLVTNTNGMYDIQKKLMTIQTPDHYNSYKTTRNKSKNIMPPLFDKFISVNDTNLTTTAPDWQSKDNSLNYNQATPQSTTIQFDRYGDSKSRSRNLKTSKRRQQQEFKINTGRSFSIKLSKNVITPRLNDNLNSVRLSNEQQIPQQEIDILEMMNVVKAPSQKASFYNRKQSVIQKLENQSQRSAKRNIQTTKNMSPISPYRKFILKHPQLEKARINRKHEGRFNLMTKVKTPSLKDSDIREMLTKYPVNKNDNTFDTSELKDLQKKDVNFHLGLEHALLKLYKKKKKELHDQNDKYNDSEQENESIDTDNQQNGLVNSFAVRKCLESLTRNIDRLSKQTKDYNQEYLVNLVSNQMKTEETMKVINIMTDIEFLEPEQIAGAFEYRQTDQNKRIAEALVVTKEYQSGKFDPQKFRGSMKPKVKKK